MATGSATIATGGWAWSALFQHAYGTVDHLDDESHFRILLKLLDVAPLDDGVLFMIGDGPLSHAAGEPARYAQIRALATKDPKLARAWWLNETDGGRLRPSDSS